MANQVLKVNIFDLEEEDFDTVLATDIDFSGSVELKKTTYDKRCFYR